MTLDGAFESVNPALATLLGLESSELEGRRITEFVPDADLAEVAARLQHVIETGEPLVGLESRALTARAEEISLLVSAALIHDAAEAPSLILVEVLDVTASKRAETEREQAFELVNTQNALLAEADRLKDELISVVSHDLRTPLTSIMGYLELVMTEESGALNDEQRQFLEVVRRNADRLLALVNDLLFISRTEQGAVALDLTEVDLAAVAVEAIEALEPQAAESEVELILRAEAIPTALADRARMADVLANLLTNALKFTAAGGTVETRLTSTATHVVLEVADSGVGIAEADQQHLFQRFFRSARTQATPGIGLGLSIVKAIVDAHGGDISLTSRVNEGTTFRVEIPLVPPAPGESPEPVGAAAGG